LIEANVLPLSQTANHRNHRQLKSSKTSIVEDLTSLNLEVLNRLRNSDLGPDLRKILGRS